MTFREDWDYADLQGLKYVCDFQRRENISFFEVERKGVIWKKKTIFDITTILYLRRDQNQWLAFMMQIKESKALQIPI